MSGWEDLAAFIGLLGERFERSGLAPPRMVISHEDADRLRAMVPPDALLHYGDRARLPENAVLRIGGVTIYTPRERPAE